MRSPVGILACRDSRCGHRRIQHSYDRADDFACRVAGCLCSGWDDPARDDEDDEDLPEDPAMSEPYCERDPKVDPDFCVQDVHGWFELSYASYAVMSRTLMQHMPAEWQHAMVNLLHEMHEAFPESPGRYTVLLRDDADGRFVSDTLRNYRYPNERAIEAARGRTAE